MMIFLHKYIYLAIDTEYNIAQFITSINFYSDR